jgi:hypothetical protein
MEVKWSVVYLGLVRQRVMKYLSINFHCSVRKCKVDKTILRHKWSFMKYERTAIADWHTGKPRYTRSHFTRSRHNAILGRRGGEPWVNCTVILQAPFTVVAWLCGARTSWSHLTSISVRGSVELASPDDVELSSFTFKAMGKRRLA